MYDVDYTIPQLNSLVGDWARTNAYADFLLSGVCKDKTVVDCGAGSGLCSYLALRGGAHRVIACDISTEICDHLEELFQHNYRVSVQQLDLCIDTIPKGDLYIHELVGNALYGEGIRMILNNMKSQGITNIHPHYARVTNGYVNQGVPKPSDNMDYMLRNEVLDFLQYNEKYVWNNSFLYDHPEMEVFFAQDPDIDPWLYEFDLREAPPQVVKETLHDGAVIWQVGFDSDFKNYYTNVNPQNNNWNVRTPYSDFIKFCNLD